MYDILSPHRSSLIVTQTVTLGPVAHDLGMLATLLGRHDEADGHFRHAVDIQERIGDPPPLVHTRVEWARMLLRRDGPGDHEQARALLEAARQGVRDLEMTGVESDVEALLAEVT